MRVLTGPRWRLGGRDIAALWRRAVELDDRPTRDATTEQIVAQAAADADAACLADAICDPGPASGYSAAGHRADRRARPRADRAARPSHAPAAGTRRRGAPGAWRRRRSPGGQAGGIGLVRHRAPRRVRRRGGRLRRPAGATVPSLLAYLDAAEQVENGLAPADVSVANDRVQILTVHAAKGLEWQVVAVPHLSGRVFPSTASTRTWLTDAGDLPPLLRGDRATVSEHGVPVLDTSDVNDRKRLSDKISDHKRRLEQRRIDEERRLLYVALTRAEDTLLLSGHHWGASEAKPRGPSDFLCELKDIIETSEAAGDPCGVVEQWAPTPVDGEPNPLRDRAIEARWPADPAGARRNEVEGGAALVAQAMSGGLDARPPPMSTDGRPTSTPCWPNASARPTRPRRRCPPSCRSARWWNSAATPTASRSGCAVGCRPGPIHMPCWAPHFTTGCSGSSTPSGCSTSTTCPVPSTVTPATPTISPNCRPRSRCRRGPRARRSTWRCRSTW